MVLRSLQKAKPRVISFKRLIYDRSVHFPAKPGQNFRLKPKPLADTLNVL